eukprot:1321582-Amorphochlora_amoeboformis.AAC.3
MKTIGYSVRLVVKVFDKNTPSVVFITAFRDAQVGSALPIDGNISTGGFVAFPAVQQSNLSKTQDQLTLDRQEYPSSAGSGFVWDM